MTTRRARHVERVERVEMSVSSRAVRQAWHSQNAWVRHVERVESCRDVTWQAKWNLGLSEYFLPAFFGWLNKGSRVCLAEFFRRIFGGKELGVWRGRGAGVLGPTQPGPWMYAIRVQLCDPFRGLCRDFKLGQIRDITQVATHADRTERHNKAIILKTLSLNAPTSVCSEESFQQTFVRSIRSCTRALTSHTLVGVVDPWKDWGTCPATFWGRN